MINNTLKIGQMARNLPKTADSMTFVTPPINIVTR